MDVGSLMASLKLNTSQFTGALRSAVSSASKAAKDISNAFGGTAVKGIESMSKALDSLKFKASGAGKDIARITQGIIFSQAFYRSLNLVQDAIGGVVGLAKEAEVATRSFAVMLKDQEQAVALVEYLKSFAAETNFNFTSASDAARQLLAYGFKLGELDNLMRTIGDTAAAMGDSEAFSKVARALGQIRTKGKLATQEILQLTEAGIPAYEILQEKLGLTKDQLADIGKAGIDADTAIKALTAGMQERFGGSMALMADTVDGYLNNIVESFNAIAVKITEPFYKSFKSLLRNISTTMSDIWEIVNTSGTGGLVNSMFSAETAEIIRQVVGAFQILWASIKNLMASLAPLIAEFIKIATAIGGIVIPVISLFLNTLSALLQMAYANTNVLNGLRIVITGLIVIKTVTFLVRGLATAFALLTSPVFLTIAAITSLVALIATLAGQGSKVVGVINNIGKSLNKLYGVRNEDILPPEFTDPPTLDGVLGDMSDLGDAAEDVGDATEDAGDKAKKAAKNLMSFDEVFNLNDNSDSGSISAPDIEVPDYSEIVGQFDDMNFDMGFDEEAFDFGLSVQNMVDSIKDSMGGLVSSMGGYVGEIADKLMPKLKDAFNWLFSETTMRMPMKDALLDLVGSIKYAIVDVLWPIATDFTTRFILPIVSGFTQYLMPVFRDVLNAVIQVSSNLLKNASDIVKALYDLFKPIIDFITNVFVDCMKLVYDAWAEHGQGIVDSITGVIDSITRIFLKLINEVLKPIVEPFMENLQKVWDEHIKGTLAIVLDFVAYLIEVAGEIWVKFVEPICMWLIDFLKPAFIDTCDFIGDVINALLITICAVTDGIVLTLKGIIEFLMGVFTGDWQRALDGLGLILDGFGAFFKGIIEAIHMVLDGFIDWMDGATRGEFTAIFNYAKQVLDIFFDAAGKLIQAMVDTLKGCMQFITGVFTGNWKMAWEGILKILRGWFDGLSAIFGAAIELIALAFSKIYNAVKSYLAWILQNFKENTAGIRSVIQGLIESIKSILSGLINFIIGVFTGNWSRAWQGVVDIFKGIFNGFKNIAKAPLNAIIDMVNAAITGINGLIWTVNKIPGIELDTIPKIPALARGGVVTRHTLAEIGEGNKKEAVIPLENGNAIDMIASRIMEGMSAISQPAVAMAGYPGTGYDTQQPIMYVGTLIADDKSLKELERRMQVIRQGETRRRG